MEKKKKKNFFKLYTKCENNFLNFIFLFLFNLKSSFDAEVMAELLMTFCPNIQKMMRMGTYSGANLTIWSKILFGFPLARRHLSDHLLCVKSVETVN